MAVARVDAREEMGQEIAIQGSISVEGLLVQAMKNNVPVETVERILAMRRELKAEFAKEQFDMAMAAFQGECPVIEKTKEGGKTTSGIVAYYYAPLESIVKQTKNLIQKHGFSYSVKTKTQQDMVEAICVVKHMAGHSEESSFQVPLGARTGVMSAPQVTASALTFAKRYAFCNAFGILTGDQDDDAQVVGGSTEKRKKVNVLVENARKGKPSSIQDFEETMTDPETGEIIADANFRALQDAKREYKRNSRGPAKNAAEYQARVYDLTIQAIGSESDKNKLETIKAKLVENPVLSQDQKEQLVRLIDAKK